ncbi:hypothetical protein [Acetobacter sp. UBA5411]|uniref:hypothetical protein n=1 Tax=Acetobacter sp. UBA5411 TaxID=1945905 RepID=UPI0025BF3DBA|nr:hypothetical protein [Acetobacter sp. UBA5411]
MTTEYVRGQSGETGWSSDKPMLHVSLSECFADHLVDCLRGLTLDLASVLMQRGALNFGLAERRAAGGATELILGEGADIAALDRQLRAALGAAGFELPERDGGGHEVSPSDDWDEARRNNVTLPPEFIDGMATDGRACTDGHNPQTTHERGAA